jgi:thioredoxin-like negative regulator of GroEL
VYPTPEVTALIDEQFVPVRIHIKEQPRMWHRFRIRATPTLIALAPDGVEVRRIEGFLPADELEGQLRLALGYLAANSKDWATAERWFGEAAETRGTDAGPEGQYWRGVARYSASHDANELKETYRSFTQRYQNTSWAKRASVWGP